MGLTKVSGDILQTPLNVGVVTATRIDGNVSGNVNSTGVSTFSTLKVGTGVTISGGIVTATSFVGNITGNVTGNATGLSGTPNVTVGTIGATSLNASGIVTATSFVGDITGNVTGNATGLSGTPNITVGAITAASATITGNVSVAGTVTYEDTTNVDSIGIVTARSGIVVNSGGINVVAGVATFPSIAVSGVGTFGTSLGVATTNPITRFQVGSATSQSVFITSTGLVGLGSTAPRVSLDLSQKTDAIALPQGTTAQRPSGNSPYIRYNTTNSALEFYNGTDWVEIISDYFPSGSTILG